MCSLLFYKTFFGVELSFFSRSPKVVFWTNCAFPLRRKKGMTLELCSLIEYEIWNIFKENHAENVHQKLVPNPFCNFGK